MPRDPARGPTTAGDRSIEFRKSAMGDSAAWHSQQRASKSVEGGLAFVAKQ